MVELSAALGDEHDEMRVLLADLARQPPITETITGPELRARRRAMLCVQRAFFIQLALRLRYVWPALSTASPGGRAYVARAWNRSRLIQVRMAKRQWCGERDVALNDLEAHISSEIAEFLRQEARHLARLDGTGDGSADAGRLDAVALEVRRQSGAPWPTRPHPDLPRSPRLARLMLRPLALTDRALDRLSRPME